MPPSGFSNSTARSLSNFAEGCHKDLHEEVKQGKHTSFKEGQEFEARQIGKALVSTEDQFDSAVLRLVQVIYEQKLSPEDIYGKTLRMHITPEGNLVYR